MTEPPSTLPPVSGTQHARPSPSRHVEFAERDRLSFGMGVGLRTFDDSSSAERLDRVWRRLDRATGRRSGRGRFRLALAAALVFGLGGALGVGFERSRSGQADSGARALLDVRAEGVAPLGEISPRAPAATPRLPSAVTGRTKGTGPAGRRASSVGRLDAREAALPEEPAVVESLPVARAEWLELAERGEYIAASRSLDDTSGYFAVLREGSPEELMTLADVARFAGQSSRAIEALRVVTVRYQGDPNAPMAAMMLGNLLARSGDAEGAARAYALTRALSPRGDFAEDALAREFDMAEAARDLPRVRLLLDQYEREFPGGRHLGDMQSAYDALAREDVRSHVPRDSVDSDDGPYD